MLDRQKLDRFDKYKKSKLNKLRTSYLKLFDKYARIIKIDGTKSKSLIEKEIINWLIKKNVVKNFK